MIMASIVAGAPRLHSSLVRQLAMQPDPCADECEFCAWLAAQVDIQMTTKQHKLREHLDIVPCAYGNTWVPM